MSDATHEDIPMSAADALALLTTQQRSIANERGSFVPLITISWGIAWLVGFLALWFVDGIHPGLPLGIPLAIFIVLVAAATIISIAQGIRSGRGIRGSSDTFTGTVYGVSWSAVMVAIGALGGALHQNGMSATVTNLFYACTYTFAVGLLYLMAGAIWRSVSSVVGGGWVMLVAVVSAWFGYPTVYLVLAIGAGGGFLVLAAITGARTRRIRRLSASGSTPTPAPGTGAARG